MQNVWRGLTEMSRDPRVAAYSVMRAIGKGSYGEVFLVTHCKEKKQVLALTSQAVYTLLPLRALHCST